MTAMSSGVKIDERPARNDGEQHRARCVQPAIDGIPRSTKDNYLCRWSAI